MKPFRKSGSITALHCSKAIPKSEAEFTDLLAKHRFQSIDGANHVATASGWTTCADPSGQQLDAESLDVQGAFSFRLRIDQKRVPSRLLSYHMDSAAASRGRKLSKAERSEIRDDVLPGLIERSLPASNGVDVLVFPRERLVLLFSVSSNVVDTFVDLWEKTFDSKVTPLAPCELAESVAPKGQASRVRDLAPTRFPREGQQTLGLEPSEQFLGAEFLLWLWFQNESHGGELDLESPAGQVGFSIDDLVQFGQHDECDTATTLRGGFPSKTPEAHECLKRGQMPARLRLVVAFSTVGAWMLTVEAETFALSSVKLPDEDDLEEVEDITSERVEAWRMLHLVFAATFARFVELRLDGEAWAKEREELISWMGERA